MADIRDGGEARGIREGENAGQRPTPLVEAAIEQARGPRRVRVDWRFDESTRTVVLVVRPEERPCDVILLEGEGRGPEAISLAVHFAHVKQAASAILMHEAVSGPKRDQAKARVAEAIGREAALELQSLASGAGIADERSDERSDERGDDNNTHNSPQTPGFDV